MKIELCCANKKALLIAENFHFDSIELCRNLEVGGLTPELKLINTALNFSTKQIRILIRPRAGHFCSDKKEQLLIYKQIEQVLSFTDRKIDIVTGVLNNKSEINIDFLKEIKSNFPQTLITFHRAIDLVKDKNKAFEQLIDLGIERVLTSGNAHFPIEKNTFELKNLVKKFGKKIEIALGGGITPENIKLILKESKTQSIHFSGCEKKNNKLKPSLDKINGIFNGII
ncbi:MAG: hypothetical protein HYU67_06265 [Flavobacteriia bacterium]|nr:hypothetical protein [Flavobacteriia bacterium]